MVVVIKLGSLDNAFTRGGNRLCFADPTNPQRVIKIARPDRTPAIKRAQHSFPRNLKAERYFDENWQELRVYQKIASAVGPAAYDMIPRCHGLVATDLGQGLATELIRDHDGRVSLSLKQYLWLRGQDSSLTQVIAEFIRRWGDLGMPSRNLLLHNIVVQCGADGPDRLVVIDGLGWADILPLAYVLPSLARRKARRKASRLPLAIEHLMDKQKQGKDWGYHGWLDETERQVVSGNIPAPRDHASEHTGK